MFWNIPAKDLAEVQKVWERTVQVIREGIHLYSDGRVTRNNLPKQSENPVAHVRPHAKNMEDTYPLPDGRRMPKQCFWLNRSYVEQVVKGKEYISQTPTSQRIAAEKIAPYGNKKKQ